MFGTRREEKEPRELYAQARATYENGEQPRAERAPCAAGAGSAAAWTAPPAPAGADRWRRPPRRGGALPTVGGACGGLPAPHLHRQGAAPAGTGPDGPAGAGGDPGPGRHLGRSITVNLCQSLALSARNNFLELRISFRHPQALTTGKRSPGRTAPWRWICSGSTAGLAPSAMSRPGSAVNHTAADG